MSDNAAMTPALRCQADRDLARRSVPGVFAYLFLWGIVASVSELTDTHPWLIWSVGGIYVVLAMLRLVLVWRFDELHERSAAGWRRGFAAGALLSGAVWGAFCAAALHLGGLDASSVLVLLPTAGIAAGAAVALAPLGGVMAAMLALLLWPAIPMSILAGHALGMGVAMMFLTYYAFLVLIGRRMHAEYWRALRQNAAMEALAAAAERQRQLHVAVGGVLDQYVRDIDPRVVFDDLLRHCIELSGSEYGFIGEVLHAADGKPYLKTYALTDIAWNAEWKALYQKYAPQGMEFRNLNTLFGAALVTGQPVIANDPAHDPRAGGLPPGHPPLRAFLGVPLNLGDHLVGLVGLANRPGGYDQDLIDFLRPLFGTCAQIIETRHNEASRREARAAQQAAARQMRAILDTVVDGIITIDEQGMVETFNPAAERIFGYGADEVIGCNVNMLMPEPFRSAHDAYLANYLNTGQRRIIGIGREVMGRRKDGSTFPLDLAVSETYLGERRVFTGLVRDITERRRAEEALSRFKGTLDRTLDCVFMFEPDTLRFFYVNRGAMEQVGYDERELMSMHPYDIKPTMPEPKFRQFIAPLLRGEQSAITFETEHQHRDGHRVPVEIFLQYIAPEGEQARFVAIVRDITERKKVERLKSEFVSTVSHELRTPLTSIRGALGLIAAGVSGALPDKARELVDMASKNSDRLSQLINDLLDIEKIESGRMQFVLRPHSIRTLVEQSIAANAAYGQQYRVTFRLLGGEPELTVNVDADRFMQVMANLLSNAAKFSPADSQVDIAVARRGASVRISVRDRGPGVPQEFHSRMFQKFSQADGSDTRAKGGTGLGLSIVKAILGHFGGSIDFETGADGTTFYFDLPLLNAAPSGASPDLPRVLVCEDDPDVARLIAMMLEHAGWAADVVHGAVQARSALVTGHYRAMTLDLRLPDGDGIELIQALREDPRTRALPVVVVSGVADEGRVRFNGGFGIVDWLGKPIDEARLVAAVESAAASKAEGRRPLVLHVEDDADTRRIVASLGAHLADFEPAETVAQAKRRLGLGRYALVILDLALPDGSGWELLPLIHALDPPPPVLVFSGTALDADGARQVASALLKASASNEDILKALRGLLSA